MATDDVWELAGGHIFQLHKDYPATFHNACALRVSYSLNHSGIDIPYIAGVTFKGLYGFNYFIRAPQLFDFMSQTFGSSGFDVIKITGDVDPAVIPNILQGNKGIYIMLANDQSANGFKASGHCSLFNEDHCIPNSFGGAAEYYNPKGGLKKIGLWILPTN